MPGASATSRSACTIRSGTTICRTCRSPITGRSTPKDKMGDWLEFLHQDHGARLLVVEPVQARLLGRQRMDGRGGAGRRAGDLEAQAPRAGDRHVGLPRGAALPGRRRLQGRAASFEPASRRRRLGRQEVRGRGLEQFRARYRGRSLGARRRRDPAAALADPGRARRDARPQPAALFGGGGRQGHHDRQGRLHRGVAALCAAAQGLAAGGGADQEGRRGLLRRPAQGGLQAHLRRGRVGGSVACISAAARATTSTSAHRS